MIFNEVHLLSEWNRLRLFAIGHSEKNINGYGENIYVTASYLTITQGWNMFVVPTDFIFLVWSGMSEFYHVFSQLSMRMDWALFAWSLCSLCGAW